MARRRTAGRTTSRLTDSERLILNPRRHLARAIGLGLIMATSSVWAQQPTDEDLVLPPVDVRAQRRLGEYRLLYSDLFKVPSELADYPQSVTIVPQELMREQADFTLREALRNVTGIGFVAGEGGGAQGDNHSQARFRGSLAGSTSTGTRSAQERYGNDSAVRRGGDRRRPCRIGGGLPARAVRPARRPLRARSLSALSHRGVAARVGERRRSTRSGPATSCAARAFRRSGGRRSGRRTAPSSDSPTSRPRPRCPRRRRGRCRGRSSTSCCCGTRRPAGPTCARATACSTPRSTPTA